VPGMWERIRSLAPYVLALTLSGIIVISIPDHGMEQNGFLMQAAGYTLLAFAGASMIVYSIDPASQGKLLTRFLRTSFMRFLGKYSYAMYIIHFPLAWLLEEKGFGVSMFPLIGGSAIPSMIAFTLMAGTLTTMLALLSWHLFEKRLLRLKRFFPRVENFPDQPGVRPADGQGLANVSFQQSGRPL
jgi:peptidoglycan/LPS O-acetylase OafA/YrhL